MYGVRTGPIDNLLGARAAPRDKLVDPMGASLGPYEVSPGPVRSHPCARTMSSLVSLYSVPVSLRMLCVIRG